MARWLTDLSAEATGTCAITAAVIDLTIGILGMKFGGHDAKAKMVTLSMPAFLLLPVQGIVTHLQSKYTALTNHQDTRPEKANPFAKNTYRVLNEPYNLLGILDWRYGFCAAVPAVFFGLVGHSVIAGLIAFGLLAWQVWRIAEDIRTGRWRGSPRCLTSTTPTACNSGSRSSLWQMVDPGSGSRKA